MGKSVEFPLTIQNEVEILFHSIVLVLCVLDVSMLQNEAGKKLIFVCYFI